jgi:hypothetical protein
MTRAARLFALPFVLLALWLQAGAAVAAARAQAEAANPFAAIPVCSPDAPKAAGKGEPAEHHGAAHCAACLVHAAATAPPLLDSAEIAFPDAPAVAAGPALDRHVQARGPPLYRPHARGPPTLS